MIKLTRIVRKRNSRVKLTFNTGEKLEAPSRVVNEMDVQENDTYSLERLRREIREIARDILPELARSHLSQYTKTSSEFVEHFTRKGYPESLVLDLKSQLREEGFLDDEEVARRHLERRLSNKAYGREKLIAELREKGFDRREARSLVNEVYPPEKERLSAREYVENNDELDPRKLMSRLKNRGFSGSIIRDIVTFPTE